MRPAIMEGVDDRMVAFLEARYAESEAAAMAAIADLGMSAEWRESTSGCLDIGLPDYGGEDWTGYVWPQGDSRVTRFIAANDPARALREAVSNRATVKRCATWMNEPDAHPNGLVSPRAVLARQILANMAAVFAGHPDYDQDWPPAA